ncbi:hypothetical protein NDI76_19650 [Halogeometricum sp. S1BR25-6]|uniref:Uncharacterized protein n=1 Tax=Halogeometricum salsisoli TaxID=2950536 RepID=A0ABU2GJL0_9EURY|nr:hypothetical protein [Halogeometricum sp. S1BR25-6]MDS0300965.1 hypothetical protein [Halogeometricum sp. S1BR25-6]
MALKDILPDRPLRHAEFENLQSQDALEKVMTHAQFERVSENIRKNLANADQEGVDDIQIAFMEFDALFELFRFYEAYWSHMSDSRIREKFHEFTIGALRGNSDDVHFGSDLVNDIREKLLDTVDSLLDSLVSRYSE